MQAEQALLAGILQLLHSLLSWLLCRPYSAWQPSLRWPHVWLLALQLSIWALPAHLPGQALSLALLLQPQAVCCVGE